MKKENVLDVIHPTVLLAVILLVRIEWAEGKDIWCCRGWSDDDPSTQVETKECSYSRLCYGETYCNDDNKKECATNWECPSSTNNNYPNKTDDDCTNPEAGKACYCDKPWCNCPKPLKGKETPLRRENLKCCSGMSTDTPDKIQVSECDTVWKVCHGQSQDNSAILWNCGISSNQRFRKDCYKYSFKKYAGEYGSDLCGCSTNYCNCPPDKKNQGISFCCPFNLKTQFIFSPVLLLFYYIKHLS